MHVCWTFTGDGILALVGGGLALLGVWWSNRQSVRNLSMQLHSDRRTREEDQENQKRSVATVILAEIDDFYMRCLMNRSKVYESWDKMQNDPVAVEVFRSVTGEPFTVYKTSSHLLGTLVESATVRSVVACYGSFRLHVELARCYERALNELQANSRALILAEIAELRKQMKVVGEQSVQLALIACRNLAKLAAMDLSQLMIAREL